MSDFQVFLSLVAVIAFVLLMWLRGLVDSPESLVGFVVIGFAALFLGAQLVGIARRR